MKKVITLFIFLALATLAFSQFEVLNFRFNREEVALKPINKHWAIYQLGVDSPANKVVEGVFPVVDDLLAYPPIEMGSCCIRWNEEYEIKIVPYTLDSLKEYYSSIEKPLETNFFYNLWMLSDHNSGDTHPIYDFRNRKVLKKAMRKSVWGDRSLNRLVWVNGKLFKVIESSPCCKLYPLSIHLPKCRCNE